MGKAKLLGSGGSKPKNSKVIEGYALNSPIAANFFVTQKNKDVQATTDTISHVIMLSNTVGIAFITNFTYSSATMFSSGNITAKAFRIDSTLADSVTFGSSITIASNITTSTSELFTSVKLSNSTALFTYFSASNLKYDYNKIYYVADFKAESVRLSVDDNLNITLLGTVSGSTATGRVYGGQVRLTKMTDDTFALLYKDPSGYTASNYVEVFKNDKVEHKCKSMASKVITYNGQLVDLVAIRENKVLAYANGTGSSTSTTFVMMYEYNNEELTQTDTGSRPPLVATMVPNSNIGLTIMNSSTYLTAVTFTDDITSIYSTKNLTVNTKVDIVGYFVVDNQLYAYGKNLYKVAVDIDDSKAYFTLVAEIAEYAYTLRATVPLVFTYTNSIYTEELTRLGNTYIASDRPIINGLTQTRLSSNTLGKLYVYNEAEEQSTLINGIPVATVNSIKDTAVDEIKNAVISGKENEDGIL